MYTVWYKYKLGINDYDEIDENSYKLGEFKTKKEAQEAMRNPHLEYTIEKK